MKGVFSPNGGTSHLEALEGGKTLCGRAITGTWTREPVPSITCKRCLAIQAGVVR